MQKIISQRAQRKNRSSGFNCEYEFMRLHSHLHLLPRALKSHGVNSFRPSNVARSAANRRLSAL